MQRKLNISKIIEKSLLLSVILFVFLYDLFVAYFGFFDELFALISLLVISYYALVKGKLRLYRKEYYIAFLLLIIFMLGIISNLVSYLRNNETAFEAIFADSIVFFKAFIVYFALRLLSHSYDSDKILFNISKYAKLIFYLLLFVLIVDFFFKIYPQPNRYGIYSFQLFFQHSSRYAFAFAFIFLVLLPSHFYSKKGLLFLILIVGMLSLRVKYFGFVILSILILFYGRKLFKIPKIYFLSFVTCLGLLLAWVFWDWLLMYFTFDKLDDSAWSRAVVLYYSFIIGYDYFPIGTGFGTYSSYYSGFYYSWVYDQYGLDKVYGISRKYWNFVADQYWPMVLGQFGYIGLLSMFMVMYNYFALFMSHIKGIENNTQYYRFISLILGLLLLLIDSTTDAIFTQQRAVVMFIYFALIVNTTITKKDESITN